MSSGWTRLTSGKIKGQRTLTLDGAKFTPEFQDDWDNDVGQHQEVTPQSSLETEDEGTLRIKSYGSSQEQKL